MKKTIIFLLSLIFLLGAFTGCGGDDSDNTLKTYTISVESPSGGSLSCDKTTVELGSSAKFTIKPNSGKTLESFVINNGKVAVIEGADGSYTYTLNNILFDVTAKASFVDVNAKVIFNANGGACDVADKSVKYGEAYDVLPTPYRNGERFIGWFDSEDNLIVSTSKVLRSGTFELKAKWGEVSDAEKVGLEPYSITASLYDSNATVYGTVWHTENQPIAPVVQVVKANDGAEVDFSSAIVYAGSHQKFISHHISTALLNTLEFDTSYAVRVGDIAADKWSKTYYFTTRKEVVDNTNIIFVADTQETYTFNNYSQNNNELLDSEGNVLHESYYQNVLKDATTRFPNANFIAHGGDMFDVAGSEMHVREILETVQDYSFKYPTQVATGNHEYMDGSGGVENLSVLFRYDSVSMNPLMGNMYSFDYGHVHFVVMRSNDVYNRDTGSFAFDITDEQINWLRADLGAVDREKTPWVVCMMHESFVAARDSNPTEYNAKAAIAKEILPITTEYNVDVLLFGHEHATISTYPIIYSDAGVDYYGTKVKATTDTVQSVSYDGVKVDKFDFTGVDATKRGTVYHQTACAGQQVHERNKWGKEREDGLVADFIRKAYSGGIKSFTHLFSDGALIDAENSPAVKPSTFYSMYSYIEATKDSFVLRTYGVDCKGLAKSGQLSTDYGVYFEGFMLNK